MRKGTLRSRAKFPITLKYGNDNIIVSPCSSVEIEDVDALPKDLPKELMLKVK